MKVALIIILVALSYTSWSQIDAIVTLKNGKKSELTILTQYPKYIGIRLPSGAETKIQRSNIERIDYSLHGDYIAFDENQEYFFSEVVQVNVKQAELFKRALNAIDEIKIAYNYVVEEEENKILEDPVSTMAENESVTANLKLIYEQPLANYIFTYTLRVDVKDGRYRYAIYRMIPRYGGIGLLSIYVVVDNALPLSEKGLLSPNHILSNEKKYGRFNNEIYERIITPLKKTMNSKAFSDDW